MGKSTQVDAPEVPDPEKIASTDALYNRIDTYTPTGNLVFSGPQRNQATLSYSPEQQAQFDLQNQITQGGLNQALTRQQGLMDLPQLQQGIDYSHIAGMPGADQFAAQGDQLAQATYDQVANLLRPEFQAQQSQLEASLGNRGIDPSSENAGIQLNRQATMKNQTLSQAALSAVAAGRQEQARLFNQQIAARQQGIGEQMQNTQQQEVSRNILFNELQALLGQQQVSMPGTQAFFAPNQTDVTGAYGISTNAAQSNYQTQQGAVSQKNSDMAGLAGSAMGAAAMSSRSVKEDHGPVTVLDKLASVPVHKWRYHGDHMLHIGPFAEDFHEAFGVGTPLMIHYIDLLGVLLGAVKELHGLVRNAGTNTVTA